MNEIRVVIRDILIICVLFMILVFSIFFLKEPPDTIINTGNIGLPAGLIENLKDLLKP